jgi:hypothetical protein
MLRMYPHRKAKKMRLEKYRNAWFLLKLMDSPEDGPIMIQASADETFLEDMDGTGEKHPGPQILIYVRVSEKENEDFA